MTATATRLKPHQTRVPKDGREYFHVGQRVWVSSPSWHAEGTAIALARDVLLVDVGADEPREVRRSQVHPVMLGPGVSAGAA